MTRRRWIADEVSGRRAFLTGDHARHLTQVLRVKLGQQFEISTGADVRVGRISAIHPDHVEFELGDTIAATAALPITVAISIFKFDRMEWAIEKCVELGVRRIVPLIAARSESHLVAAAAKRVERWRRLANQAAEQSRRAMPPEISLPIKLKELFAASDSTQVVLSEVEEATMLSGAIPKDDSPLTLAFGPEGGWKEGELAAFKSAGWISATLGPTVLRAETAVIAAVAVCQSVMQSLGPKQEKLTPES